MGSVALFILVCLLYLPPCLTTMESTDVYGDVFTKEKRNCITCPVNKEGCKFLWRTQRQCRSLLCWRTKLGEFYGLRAKIGVWDSQNIGHYQESGASILVFSRQPTNLNIFEVGFHIFPELYNNSDVHFFTFWMRDSYSKTGCYNLRCPGFVPASGAALSLGQAVAPPSIYDGDDRYITIRLHTDPNTGDWVVYRDDLDTPSFLGYFPKDLCPELIGSAPRVAWSEFVSYPKDERGPPMNSGHFPDEGHRRAAYFEKIRIFNSKGNSQDPLVRNMECIATRQDFYKVSSIYVKGRGSYMFYYRTRRSSWLM